MSKKKKKVMWLSWERPPKCHAKDLELHSEGSRILGMRNLMAKLYGLGIFFEGKFVIRVSNYITLECAGFLFFSHFALSKECASFI